MSTHIRQINEYILGKTREEDRLALESILRKNQEAKEEFLIFFHALGYVKNRSYLHHLQNDNEMSTARDLAKRVLP